MSRGTTLVWVALLGLLLVAGCTGGSEEAVERPASGSESEPLDEKTAAAAQTRGVRSAAPKDDPKPQVVLAEMSYEWRTSPDRGLHVGLHFTNPAGGYERARGYVFLIAESTMTGSHIRAVYPWNVVMDGGLPANHTDGAHLLYRDRQLVEAFIPYERSDGHYETLRLYVFDEGGRLLTNREYELAITGRTGEGGTVKPGFDL